jgi:hypothetical protein
LQGDYYYQERLTHFFSPPRHQGTKEGENKEWIKRFSQHFRLSLFLVPWCLGGEMVFCTWSKTP